MILEGYIGDEAQIAVGLFSLFLLLAALIWMWKTDGRFINPAKEGKK